MADDTCGVCGAQPPSGARFCHECGAPMGAALVELGEGPRADRPVGSAETVTTRKGSRLLVLLAVAGVAVLAGFALLSGGSSDETDETTEEEAEPTPTPTAEPEEARPTSTPTDPDDQVIENEDLVVEVFAVDDHLPLALVEFAGDVLLFTTEEERSGAFAFGLPAGLVVWRYQPDQATFVEIARPLSEGETFGGAAIADGRVAIAAASGEGVTLWTSEDGVSWSAEPVSNEVIERGQTFGVSGVAAFGDTVVVTGGLGPDYQGLFAALPDEVRALTPDIGFRSGPGSTESIRFTGPLGLTIYELDLDTVDLTAEQLWGDPIGPDDTGRVWVRTGDSWTTRIGEEDSMFAPTALPNGEGVVAISSGRTGPRLQFSTDGLSWTDEPTNQGAVDITPWGNELAVASWQEVYAVDLRGDWTPLGLGSAPTRPRERQLTRIDSSDTLLAVGGADISFALSRPDPGAVLLTADGGALEYDPATGALTLTTDDGTRLRLSIGNASTDDRVEVDITTGEVHILDDLTGDRLASTTLADLRRLEQASYEPSADRPSLLVAVTRGETWTIDQRIGEGWPTDLLITDDRLFLLAATGTGFPAGADDLSTTVYAGPLGG